MDLYVSGLVLTLLSLADLCIGQYSSYSSAPPGCTLVCPANDGYVLRFGRTLCMCRSDLCQQNTCGSRRCEVTRLPFYGDWWSCGSETTPTPVLNRVEPIQPVLYTAGPTNPGCTEPQVTGRCRALIVRYYYDASSGTCKQFAFGGCDANQNNFHTMEECQQACMIARSGLPTTYDGSNNVNDNSNIGKSNNGYNNDNYNSNGYTDNNNNNGYTTKTNNGYNNNNGYSSNNNNNNGYKNNQVDVGTPSQAVQFLLRAFYNGNYGK